MRKVAVFALPILMLTLSLTALVPTTHAASAETVGTLDLPLLADGSPNGLVGASAVYLGGKTYVMGGRLASGDYSDAIYAYDHATGEVTRAGSLPSGRQSGAALALDGKIYYIGGAVLVEADLNADGTPETVPQATRDVLRFDPAAGGTATRLSASLPVGAWGLTATSVTSTRGYAFGGFSFDISRPGDITRQDWIIKLDVGSGGSLSVNRITSRLPYAVQDAGSALVGNRVYVFGGLSDNDNSTNPCPIVRRYNSQTGEYEDARQSVCATDGIISFDYGAELAGVHPAKLPQRAQFVSAETVRGKAYIPGGRIYDGSTSAAILEFSPSASPQVRALVPTLPQGLFGAAVSVDPEGYLVLVGGRLGAALSDLTDDIVKIRPGATAPYPPRELTTSTITGGLRLSWEAPAYDGDSPVSAYRVYRSEAGQAESLLGETPTLSFDDTTARPGIQYAYRVTAVNAAGESTVGASTSRETDATPPGAVRDMAVYPGNEEVLVRWSAPENNGGSSITGYRVYRDGTLLRSLPPSPTEFRDTTVSNGESYSYTVRAVNVKGEGAAVPARAATPAPVPDAPASVHATAEAGGVRVEWLAPAEPTTSFILYRGTLPGATGPIATITDTFFFDANVERGETYYYAVAAKNTVGESPPSSLVSVSLVTKPGAPQNVFAAPLEAAIHLTWQPPADTGEADESALRYYVSRQDPGTSTFRILDTGGDLTTTSFTDTRVLPGREYVYTVTTLNPIPSDPSAEARASAKEVQNKMPVAFLEASVELADVREQITFDASKSTDPDGSIAYYLFDFGDGSPVLNTTTPRAPYAFQSDAFFTVSLTAVDEKGLASEPAKVTIKVGTPADVPDNSRNGDTPTPTTTSGTTPGATTGKVPGPGVLAALAALGLVALIARRRRV